MKGVVVPAVKRVPNPRSVPQRPNTEEIDPKIKNNQEEKSETFQKKMDLSVLQKRIPCFLFWKK